jgi:hypothetical protein
MGNGSTGKTGSRCSVGIKNGSKVGLLTTGHSGILRGEGGMERGLAVLKCNVHTLAALTSGRLHK